MDPAVASRALVRASSDLLDGRDATGALRALLDEGRVALEVDAVSVLVRNGCGLESLPVSTRRAAELDIRQVRLGNGPCIDADATADLVVATGSAQLAARWPAVAARAPDAGFGAVLATPLRWHGSGIGAVGFFRHLETPFAPDEVAIVREFADVAAGLIAGIGRLAVGELSARCEHELGGRIVVEQAKGVLAQRHGLGMVEAYELMLRSWNGGHETLAEWSTQLVREADPS